MRTQRRLYWTAALGILLGCFLAVTPAGAAMIDEIEVDETAPPLVVYEEPISYVAAAAAQGAQLIYYPTTGDAYLVPGVGEVVNGFILEKWIPLPPENPGPLVFNFAAFTYPLGNPTDLDSVEETKIGQFVFFSGKPIDTEAYLGAILPDGLNMAGLDDFLWKHEYSIGMATHVMELVVIPEPGTMLLLAIGSAAALVRRKRRK